MYMHLEMLEKTRSYWKHLNLYTVFVSPASSVCRSGSHIFLVVMRGCHIFFGSHTHSCFAGDACIPRNAATIVNKNLSIYLTKLAKDFLKNSCSVLKWSIWRSLYITWVSCSRNTYTAYCSFDSKAWLRQKRDLKNMWLNLHGHTYGQTYVGQNVNYSTVCPSLELYSD